MGNLTPVKTDYKQAVKVVPYAQRQLVCLFLFQAFMRLIPQRMTCLHSAVSRLAKFYKLYTDFLLANKLVIFSCPRVNFGKRSLTSLLSSEIRYKIVPIALREPYVCSQPS